MALTIFSIIVNIDNSRWPLFVVLCYVMSEVDYIIFIEFQMKNSHNQLCWLFSKVSMVNRPATMNGSEWTNSEPMSPRWRHNIETSVCLSVSVRNRYSYHHTDTHILSDPMSWLKMGMIRQIDKEHVSNADYADEYNLSLPSGGNFCDYYRGAPDFQMSCWDLTKQPGTQDISINNGCLAYSCLPRFLSLFSCFHHPAPFFV